MCTCRFRWINCIQFDLQNLLAFARQVSGLKKSPIACARNSRHGAVTPVWVGGSYFLGLHMPSCQASIYSVVAGFWCDVIDLYIQYLYAIVCYKLGFIQKMGVLRMVRFGNLSLQAPGFLSRPFHLQANVMDSVSLPRVVRCLQWLC